MIRKNPLKKLLIFTLIAALAGFAWLSLPSPDQARYLNPAQTRTSKGSGELQSLNAQRGVVTIKHGALPAVGMTAMTMSYVIQDKDQLASLRPPQQVEFELSYDGVNYLITEIK